MWQHYTVTLQFRDRIVGGIPKSKEMIEGWLTARDKPELIDQTVQEMGNQLNETIETMWTGFKSDDEGLYIEGRQIKAMFKEAANIIRRAIGFDGFMRARVAEKVFITPDRVHLGVKEPTGWEEKPIHVMTRQGPRNALKRYDYVDQPRITFRIRVLDDGTITEEHLRALLDYAQEGGLGADRGQGMGKFDVVEFKEI